jgi:N-methylhydantoinase A
MKTIAVKGHIYTIPISCPADSDKQELTIVIGRFLNGMDFCLIIIEDFHKNYEREYTYRLAAPVELVTFHLIAMAEVDKLKPQKSPQSESALADAVKGEREVDYLEDGIHKATIYNGDNLAPGMGFLGLAIIEEAETTVVIPPNMSCYVDEYSNYQILTAPGGTNE